MLEEEFYIINILKKNQLSRNYPRYQSSEMAQRVYKGLDQLKSHMGKHISVDGVFVDYKELDGVCKFWGIRLLIKMIIGSF